MSWPTLRDDIESCILTFSYHADEKGAYKICANEVIKEIEKRIDEMMSKYNPIESGYQTGYYNATCEFKEMLK